MTKGQTVLVCAFLVVQLGCAHDKSDTRQQTAKSGSEPASAEKLEPLDVDLWTAAAAGNVDAVRKHLAAGVDVNAKEPVGEGTPLIMAAFAGQTEVAELLIENGASLTIKNHDGSTPLHVAAFFAHPEMVTFLLTKGADPAATNDKGQTPFDLVERPWSLFLAGYYRMVGEVLQVELDLGKIKSDRPKVADILRRYDASTSSGAADASR